MTWALNGMVLTQSGTDTDLSGLATLAGAGVTATTSGDVTTYHVTEPRRIVITGTLDVDPFTEELFVGNHASSPSPSIDIASGGTLNVNGYRSHSGDEGNIFDRTYTGDTWLHVAKVTSHDERTEEQALVVRDGGTLRWQGGSMRLNGGVFLLGGSTFYSIQAQLFLVPSSAHYFQLRTWSTDLTILSLAIDSPVLAFRALPDDAPITQIHVTHPAPFAFMARGEANGGGGTSDPIRFSNSDVANVPVHFAGVDGGQVVATNPPFQSGFGGIHGVVERVGNLTEYHERADSREDDLRGLTLHDGSMYAVGWEHDALFVASVDSDDVPTGAFERVGSETNFGIGATNPTAMTSIGSALLAVGTVSGVQRLFSIDPTTGAGTLGGAVAGLSAGATLFALISRGDGSGSQGNRLYGLSTDAIWLATHDGTSYTGAFSRVTSTITEIGARGAAVTGGGRIHDLGQDLAVVYDNEDGVIVLSEDEHGDLDGGGRAIGPIRASSGSGAVRELAGRGIATYGGRHYGLSGSGDYLFRHLRVSKVSFGLFQGLSTGGSSRHQAHYFARRTIDMDVRDVHGNGIEGAKIHCQQNRERGLVPSANVPPSDREGDFLDFDFPVADYIKTSNTYIDGSFPKEWLNYYGQDGLDGVDIGVYHYQYEISFQRYALLEHNYLADLNVHLPRDRLLTERSATTIRAYTRLDTAAKAYDALKVFVWDAYSGESRPPAIREADTLDFGDANVALRVSGTPVIEKSVASDGTVTWTLTTGEQFRGSLVTTGTVEAPAVDVVGYINHSTGRRGVLALTAHGGETVAVFEPDGDRVTHELLPGTAPVQILVESSTLHSDDAVIPGMRVVVNRLGYLNEKRSLDFDTGALQRETFDPLAEALLPTGQPMYGDGIVSAGSPVGVTFDLSDLNHVQARIDIGDAIVPVHDVYVMFERECQGDDGLKYLAFGGRKISITQDPLAGDSVALPDEVKLRRSMAADRNAGVLGVAYHPNNQPVDDVNGDVRIIAGFNEQHLEAALEAAFAADIEGSNPRPAGSVMGILQRLRAIVATIAGNTQPPP